MTEAALELPSYARPTLASTKKQAATTKNFTKTGTPKSVKKDSKVSFGPAVRH